MNFTLNFTNATVQNVCELNQYKMIEATAKLPVIMLCWATLSLLLLAAYIYIVPRLPEAWRDRLSDAVVLAAFASLVWTWLFCFELTLHPTAEFWNGVMMVLLFVVVFVVGLLLWRKRKGISDFVNQ